MLEFIKNLFKKEQKPEFDIAKFESRWPVGSWYTSGSRQVVRLSNVYKRDGKPLITVEYPYKTLDAPALKETFTIRKDDDLSPSYLNGWTKVSDAEQAKLERSYWKTIEMQLERETSANKKSYDDFLRLGGK